MKVRGFTLVELLVGIAIIAVLIAVSMSALSRAREQVKATVCQTHQRQLLLEFATYEGTNRVMPFAFDYMGFSKPPGGTAGNMMRDPAGWWWFHALGIPTPERLGNKASILRCPARRITDIALGTNCLYGNYGVNWSVFRGSSPVTVFNEFKGMPLGAVSLPQASRTLLIVDSGYAVISWYHVTADPPLPLSSRWGCEASYVPGLGINQGRDLLPGQKEDALEGRHANKTVNVGFADGHIERRPAETLQVTKTAEGYANLHPLWRPSQP